MRRALRCGWGLGVLLALASGSLHAARKPNVWWTSEYDAPARADDADEPEATSGEAGDETFVPERDWDSHWLIAPSVLVVGDGDSAREGADYYYETTAPSLALGARFLPPLSRHVTVGFGLEAQYYVGGQDFQRSNAGRFLFRPQAIFEAREEGFYLQVPFGLVSSLIPSSGVVVQTNPGWGLGFTSGIDFGLAFRRGDMGGGIELGFHYDRFEHGYEFTSATGRFTETVTYELLWFRFAGTLLWSGL